jgi:hypothetical protein
MNPNQGMPDWGQALQQLVCRVLYWTTRVKLVELIVDPLVPVTTTVDCPAGVPGFGGRPELPLLPPPQLGTTRSSINVSNRKSPPPRCCFPLIRTEPRSNPIPIIHAAGEFRPC